MCERKENWNRRKTLVRQSEWLDPSTVCVTCVLLLRGAAKWAESLLLFVFINKWAFFAWEGDKEIGGGLMQWGGRWNHQNLSRSLAVMHLFIFLSPHLNDVDHQWSANRHMVNVLCYDRFFSSIGRRALIEIRLRLIRNSKWVEDVDDSYQIIAHAMIRLITIVTDGAIPLIP